MATQFDVYISCVKADRERVQQVRDLIEKQGYSCWCHALAFHSLPVRFACVEAPPLRRSVHFRKILWSSDVFRLHSAAGDANSLLLQPETRGMRLVHPGGMLTRCSLLQKASCSRRQQR
jgi:hypothetical protein